LFAAPAPLPRRGQHDRVVSNSIGMRLVRIPPGKFLMGSPQGEEGRDGNEIQHEVENTRGFYLGAFEVTQGQFAAVMGAHPSYHSRDGKTLPTTKYYLANPAGDESAPSDTRDHAVENVTWDDAVAFCEKLSALPAEKAAGRVYRLPTEAEWEYACRAGASTAYHYGASPSSCLANLGERRFQVGSYPPNAFGLYDMHGNVWEWCADAPRSYTERPACDPCGPMKGDVRVIRGGGGGYVPDFHRSAKRNYRSTYLPDWDLGFRVVMARR
jgi:formylglycine-generating enzyme required for sulfatase activity